MTRGLGIITLGLAAVLAGCGTATNGGEASPTAVASTSSETKLHAAASSCNVPGMLSDADRTLILDGQGKGAGSGDVDYGTQECVFNRLAMTAAVLEHLKSTRALDGQQTDKWDTLEARWTYHPDSGLDVTLTEP